MTDDPKINPCLMWAAVSRMGVVFLVGDETEIRQAAYSNETVQRVLVSAPPKRRKRRVNTKR